MKAAVQIWEELGELDAIIGDTCSVACQPLALLSAAWNIPVISNLCTSDALSNTVTYPTFGRVVGVYKNYLPILLRIVETFKWKHIGIITSTYDLFRDLAVATRNLMENNGITVAYYTTDFQIVNNLIVSSQLQRLRNIIHDIRNQARIIFIMHYSTETRVILAAAYEKGLHMGDYTFLGLEARPDIAIENIYRPDIPRNALWQGYIHIKDVFTLNDFDQFQKDCMIAFETIKQMNGTNVMLSLDDIHEVDQNAGNLT